MAKAMATQGRGLITKELELVKEALMGAGKELRAKVLEGWLLPAMTIYYAAIA
jgi:hypothetical protein